ncbi:hypothetical protein DRH29_01625 [candidate division Kazan bacterium]|uniref:Uncharacterized protein n=1 Tax=candidate division Kazan bacterium TaxID=2202143 RepID=A0A420ZD30_UNCK3|nr:MAG: hypothetical protein DRH29_01625 [candidate division Kazan bacterium]
MAKNKKQKQTSVYLMVLLIVALVIAGALIYLWVKSFTPASEASTSARQAAPFIDYTGTMNYNGQTDTLVLGILKPSIVKLMQERPDFEGDPVIKAENKIKEIQSLIRQAKNLIATITGEATTPVFNDEETIEEEPAKNYVTPLNDFSVYEPTDDGDISPDRDDKPDLSLPNLVPDFASDSGSSSPTQRESTKDSSPTENEPESLIDKVASSAKNLVANTTNLVADFFKNTWSKITGRPYISSYTISRFALSQEVEIKIKGNNFHPNKDENDTTLAPEPGSSITIAYTNGDVTTLSDRQFFGSNTQLTAYTKDYAKTISKITFTSRERGSYSKSMPVLKQITPIQKDYPLSLSGYRVTKYSISNEIKVSIFGNNFYPDKPKDATNLAMKAGSKIKLTYANGTTATFDHKKFFGTNTELTLIIDDNGRKIVKVEFINSKGESAYTTNNQTPAPTTGGEPEMESVRPQASLSSFKAENLAIGGAKITIFGSNLKVGTAKNLAPEKGSRLTIFFDDFTNREFKDTEFMVANDSIVAYSNEKFRKVARVYFESPTFGIKSTQTGTTITQPPVNEPKITGYKIMNYNIYDQLMVEGENLLVSSNRSDKDEQVVIMYRDNNSRTYTSNEFYGSPTRIYIIGDVDEFSNIGTVYFESKSRGLASTSNQLSLINVANFLVNKVLAAVSESENTTFGIKAKNRRQAYDDLKDEVDNILAQLETYGDELNAYVVPSQPTGDSLGTKIPTSSTSGLTIRGDLGETETLGAAALKQKLKSASRSIYWLKRDDPVLKTWDSIAEFQANGVLGFDFDLKYASNGVVFIKLNSSNSNVQSLVNEIANNRTILNALMQVGRSAFPGGYDTPAWIREALKTAKNRNTNLTPAAPALNEPAAF